MLSVLLISKSDHLPTVRAVNKTSIVMRLLKPMLTSKSRRTKATAQESYHQLKSPRLKRWHPLSMLKAVGHRRVDAKFKTIRTYCVASTALEKLEVTFMLQVLHSQMLPKGKYFLNLALFNLGLGAPIPEEVCDSLKLKIVNCPN